MSPIDGPSGRVATLRGRGPTRSGELVERVEVSLTFDDNRLASLVFGQYDQNVAHLERRLDVTATALGNHVVLKGSPEAAEKARRVFERLYARVKTGGTTLTLGDVDGAIPRDGGAGQPVSRSPDRGRARPSAFRTDRHPPSRRRAGAERRAGQLHQGAARERTRLRRRPGRHRQDLAWWRWDTPYRCWSRAMSSG